MTNKDELLACPFCNSKEFSPVVDYDEEEKHWYVGCMAHCEGGCGIQGEFTSKEYAIAAWNTRPNTTQLSNCDGVNSQLDSVITELQKLRDTDCGDPDCIKEAILSQQIAKLKQMRGDK